MFADMKMPSLSFNLKAVLAAWDPGIRSLYIPQEPQEPSYVFDILRWVDQSIMEGNESPCRTSNQMAQMKLPSCPKTVKAEARRVQCKLVQIEAIGEEFEKLVSRIKIGSKCPDVCSCSSETKDASSEIRNVDCRIQRIRPYQVVSGSTSRSSTFELFFIGESDSLIV
jgi:hypothetical protein